MLELSSHGGVGPFDGRRDSLHPDLLDHRADLHDEIDSGGRRARQRHVEVVDRAELVFGDLNRVFARFERGHRVGAVRFGPGSAAETGSLIDDGDGGAGDAGAGHVQNAPGDAREALTCQWSRAENGRREKYPHPARDH